MHPILKVAYIAVVLCLTAYAPDTGKVLPDQVLDYQLPTL